MMVNRKLWNYGSEFGKKNLLVFVCENVLSINLLNFKGLVEVFEEF